MYEVREWMRLRAACIYFLWFVVLVGRKKDTCYWRMVVNKGDREEHVFIFVWFAVFVGRKKIHATGGW